MLYQDEWDYFIAMSGKLLDLEGNELARYIGIGSAFHGFPYDMTVQKLKNFTKPDLRSFPSRIIDKIRFLNDWMKFFEAQPFAKDTKSLVGVKFFKGRSFLSCVEKEEYVILTPTNVLSRFNSEFEARERNRKLATVRPDAENHEDWLDDFSSISFNPEV